MMAKNLTANFAKGTKVNKKTSNKVSNKFLMPMINSLQGLVFKKNIVKFTIVIAFRINLWQMAA